MNCLYHARRAPSLAILACLMFAGCASFSRRTISDADTISEYRSMRLTYQIDAGSMGVPIAVSRVGARHVSYEEVPSNPVSGRSTGTLEIQYPHPAKREGMALVGVVIRRRHEVRRGMIPEFGKIWRSILGRDELFLRGSDDEAHEAWVLDITKAELDQILAALRRQRFFDPQAPSSSCRDIRLTAKINGRRKRGRPGQIPELDHLMHRARTAGQLVSFHGAAGNASSAWQRPASLVAYENFTRSSDVPNRSAPWIARQTPPDAGQDSILK